MLLSSSPSSSSSLATVLCWPNQTLKTTPFEFVISSTTLHCLNVFIKFLRDLLKFQRDQPDNCRWKQKRISLDMNLVVIRGKLGAIQFAKMSNRLANWLYVWNHKSYRHCRLLDFSAGVPNQSEDRWIIVVNWSTDSTTSCSLLDRHKVYRFLFNCKQISA